MNKNQKDKQNIKDKKGKAEQKERNEQKDTAQDAGAVQEKHEEQKENEVQAKEPWTPKRVFLEILPYLGVIAAALFLNTFIIINARIPSASMETTVMTGEHVFGNRLAYTNADPERYQIIIFHFPDDEKRLFIKRIIGLPGDTIELKNGQVYINGVNDMENEPFVSSDLGDNYGPYTVPEDCYFVMGDNRGHSNDSRFWKNTCVKRSQIVGGAGFRYWPLNKMGFINKYADN